MSIVKDIFTPSKGVSVDSEVVVGDKEEENKLQVGSEQHAQQIINQQDIPPEFFALFVLGWLLPGPDFLRIYQRIKSMRNKNA